MIFVLAGSSASGKSTIAHALVVEDLEIHDSDENGVPSDADTAWRQQDTESWLQRAAVLEDRDLLVTTQSPLGEVLAAPSATQVDGIAVALIDVEDRLRSRRSNSGIPVSGPRRPSGPSSAGRAGTGSTPPTRPTPPTC